MGVGSGEGSTGVGVACGEVAGAKEGVGEGVTISEGEEGTSSGSVVVVFVHDASIESRARSTSMTDKSFFIMDSFLFGGRHYRAKPFFATMSIPFL